MPENNTSYSDQHLIYIRTVILPVFSQECSVFIPIIFLNYTRKLNRFKGFRKLASNAFVYTNAIFADLSLRSNLQKLLVGDSPKPRGLSAELSGLASIFDADDFHGNKKKDKTSASFAAFCPVL